MNPNARKAKSVPLARSVAVARRLFTIVAALSLAACSGGEQSVTATEPPVANSATLDSSSAPSSALPEREGPRRETTGNVPHMQIGAEPIPAVDEELRRRAFLLPGVEDRESARSLPGARGLWLGDQVELARPDVLGDSREFAHIHPDGSLHVFLPVERAREVDETKWGELHPWVSRDGFWDGVAMIYTPETLEEVDIAIGIIVDAYNFVTGANLNAEDLS